MTTNDYDSFAEARAQEFAENKNYAHAYIEKPAMYTLLPDVAGKQLLCLGCGTGEECAELQKRGASVTGIDISSTSIKYAKRHVPNVTFIAVDIVAGLPSIVGGKKFDLIYSSLTLHYIADINDLLRDILNVLSPGGCLLFSVCHPLKWGAEAVRDPQDDKKKSFAIGYERNGNNIVVHGDYLNERKLQQKYANGLVTEYYSRSPSSYFHALQSNGYNVTDFIEPAVLPEVKKLDPVFWEINHRLPQWMIFKATKPKAD